MAAPDLFALLVAGDFIGPIIGAYTELIGDWFWVWFLSLGLLMLYNRTRDYGTVGIVALVIAIHMFPLFPPIVHLFAYVLLAISIASILYRLYH